MKHAFWYFDFISPFAYLQNRRLHEFLDILSIERKPLLFAGLLKHWGTKGPVELPGKRLFTYRQVQWMAKHQDIPLQFPERHPFNPIPLLRLCVATGCSEPAVDGIFRCIWEEGRAGDDPGQWDAFCDAAGLATAEAAERISSPEVKAELKANGEEALAGAVFGVPTLAIEGHLFWGCDSTDLALDFLAHPGMFETPDMKRLETLPGLQRDASP